MPSQPLGLYQGEHTKTTTKNRKNIHTQTKKAKPFTVFAMVHLMAGHTDHCIDWQRFFM